MWIDNSVESIISPTVYLVERKLYLHCTWLLLSALRKHNTSNLMYKMYKYSGRFTKIYPKKFHSGSCINLNFFLSCTKDLRHCDHWWRPYLWRLQRRISSYSLPCECLYLLELLKSKYDGNRLFSPTSGGIVYRPDEK